MQFVAADRRPGPSRVGVERQHNLLGEPPQQLEMIFPQGRTARRNRQWHACPMQRNHIGVALYDDRITLTRDIGLGLVEAIEQRRLLIQTSSRGC